MSWAKEDVDNTAQALKTFAEIAYATCDSTDRKKEALDRIKEAFRSLALSLQEAGEAIGDLAEIAKEPEIPDDIPALKKQIKHCKNPMELKRLNRRLNAALKQKRK